MELYQAFAAIYDDYDVVVCPGVSIPPFEWKYLNPREIDGVAVTNYMAWLALTSSITVVGHPWWPCLAASTRQACRSAFR